MEMVEYVDHFVIFLTGWKARLSGESIVPTGEEPTMADMATFRIDGKIAAIKQYRARTGVGLKESKDAIELAAGRLGLNPPSDNRLASRSPPMNAECAADDPDD